MSIRSLAGNLPKDPDNAGSVLGWGVVQGSPWRFVDIYASKDAAEAEAKSRGPRYRVEYGSHRLGSDDFMGGLEEPLLGHSS
ncbi:hypothetical protein CRX69_18305 [Pseudomonas rhizophila]|uniref:Uncharacterized protein n=1 Tax=Pseudomonas rhizophila TaxID=2045200 RepID=A0ABN5JWI3_9PSED|nr:hypothetical protein [Pseudomonas rhizophila]AVU77052.1 hypothetical protein CRX69_18305 [Pseudomonas rhizophila]